MNFRLALAWLALWLLAAGGCAATGPNVVTGSDPAVNFSTFRTFAFLGITDRGHEVGASDSSPLRGRIKEMIHREFAAKGVRQVSLSDHPDLLVHLFYGVKDLERLQQTGPPPGMSSQAKSYTLAEGNWVPVATTQVTASEDHEGTLIVDLAESSNQKLVWRAVIKAVLGNSLEKNFDLAQQGITTAFKEYPLAHSR